MERLFEGGPGEDKDRGSVGHQPKDADDGAEDELQDVPVELAPLGNSLVAVAAQRGKVTAVTVLRRTLHVFSDSAVEKVGNNIRF